MVAAIDPFQDARQAIAMRFEIFGEISGIETFATGPAFARSRGYGASMDAAVGANAKGSPKYDYPMLNPCR